MAKKIITNLHDMVSSTAAAYIFANKEEFKSETPGPQGPRGFRGNDGVDGVGVEITSILNNPNKSLTINFSDGTQHTTDPLKGQDGTSITVTNVVNNPNGTMQINFSDGTSHTTANLRGPRGFKGDTGNHVHHISYHRSKDSLGNEIGPVTPGRAGNYDTYAMWASQEELPEMYIGEFTVYNGLNTLPAEDQDKLDSVEFGATADQEAFEVVYDNSVSGLAADNVQEAIDSLNATTVKLAEKGQPDGVASLDSNGVVPACQLPSYVDDVLEFVNLAGFPATGETGKIYIALDTNKTYRWSGSTYVYITSGAVDSVAGKTGVVTLAKGDVGLGNVDNTSDLSKPISTATQNALNLKVDKVTGKGLSTEDYTTAEKTKLSGIESGAQVNTVTSVANKTGAVSLTKSDVGLSNVDNTSDADKPISTATQTALNLKANLDSPTLTGTPLAPTASTSTNTTQIATTAFVQAQKVNTALTGTPTTPTAVVGTNTTQIASTAYVKTEISNETYSKTQLNAGQLNTIYYTKANLDAGQLDTRYYTETELNNGALDTRYYTEAEIDTKLAAQNDASTNVQAALVELQGDIDNRYTKSQTTTLLAGKVDKTTYTGSNLDRADKILANQNIVNMFYDNNRNLVKIRYNSDTDTDYEVLSYTNNRLSSIDHYVSSVLKGTTTLSYTSGNLVSAIFVGV